MSNKKRKVKKKAQTAPKQKNTISSQQQLELQKAINAHSIGNLAMAEATYRSLVAGKIKSPVAYSKLGFICAQSGRIDEAMQLWEKALEISTTFVEARISMGDIYKHQGKIANAIKCYRQVIIDKPDYAQAYINLASVLLSQSKFQEAELNCQKAIKLDASLIHAKNLLGQIYISQGRQEDAHQLYDDITLQYPDNIESNYQFANLLKSQGLFEQAKQRYKFIWGRHPDYAAAHFTYSSIHRYQDKADPHIMTMSEQYQKRDIATHNKISLAFALAKAMEDVNEYSSAFKYLSQGNQLRASGFNYQFDADKNMIDNIIRVFSKRALEELKITQNLSSKPIFIVGMPRSGTSLVEKIIASHSDVNAGGELEYLYQLASENFLNPSNSYLFESLDSYSETQFELLAKSYLEKIELLNQSKSFMTDKMPFNLMMIGLIKAALPNARIIHCVRDARDNCLSLFKQNFTTNNYQFAYNLKSLGQFHNQYQKLMEHWHRIMPGAIYDVSYEQLTKKPEVEIPKLIDACGLDWQDQCLSFERNAGVVKTASAFQVRQPMYTSSVNLWQKYKEFVKPLLDELALD